MIRTIPLNKLMPSPRNVRRTTDEQADLQLKADIEARGLLQNLVVAPAKKPKGRFTVEAGGRRYRALASLADEGKLVADHEVCCLVIDSGPAAAQEAGLAENFQRLAMNPADECLAFQQLIEQGADVEGIARRFGLTVRFVEGRLRLASLAPVVFDALGAGEITLDVAKAYAATPDQERQAFVFDQVSRSYMAQHPDSIRRMMTQATVSASDRRARFVGEEAYAAAGGRIERDLFSDEDGARWLDIALLERLATEKLEALAAETAASSGLAFVRPTLESWGGYEVTRGLQRVPLEPPPLSDEESAEVDALEAETEELIGQLEDEETAEEAREAAEARVREIGARIEAITAGRGSGKRFANRIRQAAQLAGGSKTRGGARKFDGSRIGRGAGAGRVLSSGFGHRGATARRVVVKTSIVKLGRKGLARATAHMRYLQRDGTTREGEPGALYSEREDFADGKDFVARGGADRHQFRFIVAPEDGSEYEDLKPLVRRFMAQAEKDLGTKLDWVAVDHFNTGHPHSHVIVRGKDDRGKDLIIAREYLTQGLRERAAELVNLDLGPRTEREILRSQLREVEQERLTSIDRRLIRSVDAEGLVDPRRGSWVEQDLRTARLRTGLVSERRGGRWRLDPELETTLREMGRRGDIVRTINHALRIAMQPRAPQDQAIYDPDAPDARPVVGRLVVPGLADEHADRRFLIVDGVDGLTHYVDVGTSVPDARSGAIVRIEPRQAGVREVDRTVAAIAGASKGWYSVELHQFRDPTASEPSATADIRRLEALRRSGLPVEREADGDWQIPPDHLERVDAHERRLRARTPVTVALLSGARLDLLPERDGATWLDREIVAEKPVELGRGFGAEVRKAIDRRVQWLAAQRLIDLEGEDYRFRSDLVDQLERRELKAAAAKIGQESGRAFREHEIGDHVQGICRGPVQVGDRKFALVEHSLEFSLVPWRPVLERQIGREISGVVRGGGGISWTIGRERQGPSIGM